MNGDEQSAIRGHFAQRGADCFFGQQSMSCGIAMLVTDEVVACDGAANDAGPVTRPASMQIATTKRMKTFEFTTHIRIAKRARQLSAIATIALVRGNGRERQPFCTSRPKVPFHFRPLFAVRAPVVVVTPRRYTRKPATTVRGSPSNPSAKTWTSTSAKPARSR